jgi:trans-aconitate methyltransferase
MTEVRHRPPSIKLLKQANILWSYDRARYLATFDWVHAQLVRSRPASAIEMGCGTGNLLRFMRANFPDMALRGLEEEPSLAAIAKLASDIPVTETNYLNAKPDRSYDAVICNSGFVTWTRPPRIWPATGVPRPRLLEAIQT